MIDDLERLQDAIADRYQIERELGRGGMAVVYQAIDLKHGRKVAIKVLLPEVAAAIGQKRFLREIEIAARLTHPHILPLHDSGVATGQLFYVMPYIEGESLRARLERERQIPLEDALRLAREIASALGYAHHQGVVHRDIKPENVLLSDGIALVADFGIARAVGASATGNVTTTGLVVGTPLYMSPEQAFGAPGDVDARSDLYSLGCVVYEMLAGEPPFTGAGAIAVCSRHAFEAVPPLEARRPGIPEGVARTVEKALSKSPADRYSTAAQFAEALSAATSGGPTPTPRRPGPGAAVPNNLPKERTRFIGREKELAECARLLGESRLLTVSGIGGCGKTRLALKLAENLLESHPDGVWFVDLAPLTDAERVPLIMAGALGVRGSTGTPLVERLAQHIAARHMLIVLDNCEHVLEAAAELIDVLLAGCPNVRVVVTSREGLGIVGEQVVALRSLSMPAPGASDPAAIEASESVSLFVDRARLAESSFRLDATSAPMVAEICRRLDGIPLALELAAVRVKMLSIAEIRDRLDDRFRLLTGGSRTTLPRHQTLRATIGWSYDQLSPDEQRLFCDLSVFAGGWTLDGAVRVAGHAADEFEVLELLTRLRDKSLITPERAGTGATRYTMLETVRQYAQEQLNESGDGEAVRTRHLDYCVALAEEARPHFQGPEQGAWLSRFDLERENMLSAHQWCERAPGGVRADLRLVYATFLYWVVRGLLDLGYGVTVEALERPGAEATSAERMHALYAAGQCAYLRGHYDQARRHLDEGLATARVIGDRLRIASLMRALGIVAQGEGDRDTARRYMEESLVLSRQVGDKRQLAITLNGLAELERGEGNLAAAEPLCEEFVALEREIGNRGNMASGLLNLAMVTIARGSADRAHVLLLEALEIALEIGSKRVGQGVIEAASGLAAFVGDGTAAARAYGAAEAQREQMGLHRDPADQAFLAPLLAGARQTVGEAAFSAAVEAGRVMTYEAATAEVQAWLSRTRG
jgi:non-specific serine/threonine protein kinase